MRRKVAKRTNPLYIPPPPPQNITTPLSPSPQAEEIPATQEPRVEEPLPTAADEAAIKIAAPTSITGTPILPPNTTTVNALTRRKSRRQTMLPSIETSQALLDGGDDDDDDDDANAHVGDLSGPSWEARLSELAEYRKIHGHCNVPRNYSENTKLANWVMNQRKRYKLYQEGETSAMTLSRIQKLESLGFEWDCLGATWEARLSELADYRKINGHCNVPRKYSENKKLANWVADQRKQYRSYQEGETSAMPLSRIQKLEGLGFEWDCLGATWEVRLSELADYRKINGHCNVPQSYMPSWVSGSKPKGSTTGCT
jgi:predicted chitinase